MSSENFDALLRRLIAIEDFRRAILPRIEAIERDPSRAGFTHQIGAIETRLAALEKNCHEPQEIEPRVIRALLKFGAFVKDMSDGGSWWRTTGRVDPELWPQLDALEGDIEISATGTGYDTAPPITASTHTHRPPPLSPDENVDIASGAAFDALAATYGVQPRADAEPDDSLRHRIRAELEALVARGPRPSGRLVASFSGLGFNALAGFDTSDIFEFEAKPAITFSAVNTATPTIEQFLRDWGVAMGEDERDPRADSGELPHPPLVRALPDWLKAVIDAAEGTPKTVSSIQITRGVMADLRVAAALSEVEQEWLPTHVSVQTEGDSRETRIIETHIVPVPDEGSGP